MAMLVSLARVAHRACTASYTQHQRYEVTPLRADQFSLWLLLYAIQRRTPQRCPWHTWEIDPQYESRFVTDGLLP